MGERLTESEREVLRSGLAVRVNTPDPDDSYTRVGHMDDLVPVVERILADRLAARGAGDGLAGRVREAALLGRRATLDPGMFTKRGPDNDGEPYGESLYSWQTRAIDAALTELLDPDTQGADEPS